MDPRSIKLIFIAFFAYLFWRQISSLCIIFTMFYMFYAMMKFAWLSQIRLLESFKKATFTCIDDAKGSIAEIEPFITVYLSKFALLFTQFSDVFEAPATKKGKECTEIRKPDVKILKKDGKCAIVSEIKRDYYTSISNYEAAVKIVDKYTALLNELLDIVNVSAESQFFDLSIAKTWYLEHAKKQSVEPSLFLKLLEIKMMEVFDFYENEKPSGVLLNGKIVCKEEFLKLFKYGPQYARMHTQHFCTLSGVLKNIKETQKEEKEDLSFIQRTEQTLNFPDQYPPQKAQCFV